MLVAGGFMQKPAVTVLSGLFIFILPLFSLFMHFKRFDACGFAVSTTPVSGFYFFTAGMAIKCP